jgi:hypothetical protein
MLPSKPWIPILTVARQADDRMVKAILGGISSKNKKM